MARRFKWWKGRELWVCIHCYEEGERRSRTKAGKYWPIQGFFFLLFSFSLTS